MAQAPARRCNRCKAIHRESRCPQCKNQGTTKNKPGDPFYSSSKWRKLRAAKLDADPLCAAHLKKGQIEPANEVHHLKPRQSHPELAYCWENLESLCKPCHSRETQREQHSGRGQA